MQGWKGEVGYLVDRVKKEGEASEGWKRNTFPFFFIVNKYVILKLENFVIPFVKQLKYQRKMAD